MLKNYFFVLLLCPCVAQNEKAPPTPRSLYYLERQDNDKLPSRTEVKSPGLANPPTVQHFGLRLNVLLVNSQTLEAQPVDPDRHFQAGECIALQFEANRSGYLYVLNWASSGERSLIFPTLELEQESNVVKARTSLRVPAHDCFEVRGAAGTDRVFIVLSRNLEDVSKIEDSIRSSRDEPGTRVERVGVEITKMTGDLTGRDLKISKVAYPKAAGEPANSLYIVNGSRTPLDRIVAEIRLTHQ